VPPPQGLLMMNKDSFTVLISISYDDDDDSRTPLCL